MDTYKNTPIPEGSLVSPKLDGVYARATREGLFSKSGLPVHTQPHIHAQLSAHFKKNPDAILHGELYKHGQSFEKTVSAFKSGKAPLEYHVFPAGGKMPSAKGAIQHIPVTRVTSDAHAHSHYQASLKAGYEGQIIQTPDGSVQKRKPVQDSEYTVVGAAKGKKHGILTMRDGAGKTFRVQAPAHLAHEAQVGKQATVGYTRLTSSGVPHAPVFKAVRDYELSVREFACNLMKKPNVFLKKRPPIARNSMREVGQAMGGPTATFQRKGQIREFAARLRTLVCG